MSPDTRSSPDSVDDESLVDRLRNPMWAHGNIPFESPQLEQEENLAAMREAADEIERLRGVAQGSPMRAALDSLNAVAPAVENLASHQKQCDMDGVMVKVSRQALDETLAAVNEVAITLALAIATSVSSTSHRTLDQLLDGVTDANRHEELPVSPVTSTDRGAP